MQWHEKVVHENFLNQNFIFSGVCTQSLKPRGFTVLPRFPSLYNIENQKKFRDFNTDSEKFDMYVSLVCVCV